MNEGPRSIQIVCYSEALSRITHMSGTAGNEALIWREGLVTPNGVRMIPALSGNALRHRTVREPGARWLIREYGLTGRLTLAQLNFLFHGGNLTEKSKGREDTGRIATYQQLFPLGRLLGGTLPDQILAGSLDTWIGELVCQENRGYLEAVLPDPGILPARLRPAESFVSGYQYTRGDAARTVPTLARPEDPNAAGSDSSNLMIYAGQAVLRGAAFVHGFTLKNVSELEIGALLLSLRLWQAAGGTIGGQAARGHGRLGLCLVTGDFDQNEAVDAYVQHARSVRGEAVAWLETVFARKPEKAAKGKARAATESIELDLENGGEDL